LLLMLYDSTSCRIHIYTCVCEHTYTISYKQTYMYACIHTYVHTSIHIYIHIYIHACKYAYMHACENACIRYMHSFFQNSHTSVQVENAVLLLGFPIPSTAKIVFACLSAAIEPMVCANMYETKKHPLPTLTHANTQKQAPRLQGDALDPAAR